MTTIRAVTGWEWGEGDGTKERLEVSEHIESETGSWEAPSSLELLQCNLGGLVSPEKHRQHLCPDPKLGAGSTKLQNLLISF